MALIDAHGSVWVVSNSLKANQLQSEQELLKNITAHVRSGEAWGSSHLVTTVERCSSHLVTPMSQGAGDHRRLWCRKDDTFRHGPLDPLDPLDPLAEQSFRHTSYAFRMRFVCVADVRSLDVKRC